MRLYGRYAEEKMIRKQTDKDQQIVKEICAIVLTKPMDGVKYKTSKSQERSSQDDEEVLLLLLLFY